MHSTIFRITFLYFTFYCLWSFIFTQTIFFSTSSLYVGFLLLFFLFIFVMVTTPIYKPFRLEGVIWMPFLSYTILGYMISSDGENTIYRLVCVILLILASQRFLLNYIPKKFLYCSGLFAALGIFIQLLLPSFYDSYILPLFTSNQDSVYSWMEKGYGFSGFYYQLSHADMNLILAEALIICFLLYDNKEDGKRRFFLFFSVLFVILAILLTGKRSFAVMAFIIPLMVHAIGIKRFIWRVVALGTVALLLYFTVIFMTDNLSIFLDNLYFHRIAETIEEIQYAEDYSSGRKELYSSAIQLFKDNPVFGVGVGNFVEASRQYTDVHNTYLQVLCEQGIVGFVLMIFPLIICLIKTISFIRLHDKSQYSPYIKYSLFIQIYFLMYSFTGNTMVNHEVYFFYFLAIAIIINVDSAYSSQRQKSTYDYELSSSM